MTTAATNYPLIGAQPVTNSSAVSVEVAQLASGYVPLVAVGTIITVTDPFWGELELIRLSIPVSTAVRVGTASTLTNTYSYVALPNTANLGQSVAFSASDIPSNASFVQYAWFVIGGRFPTNGTASVAADTAFGITAAGQVGANSAGKQILNARVQQAATATVIKANVAVTANSPFIRVSNADGWFVGLAITGTGIPATTSIGSIDASGTLVGMVSTGTTTAQNATASGSVSVTGTYNDGTRFWNVATLQRPLAQGAIT